MSTLTTGAFERVVVDTSNNPMILFHSGWSALSNFRRSTFVVGGVTFKNVEQFYQYERAGFNNRADLQTEFLNMRSPREIHNMAGQMTDTPNWNEDKSLEVMERGLRAKFAQNAHFARILKQTGSSKIVYASPYCLFYGAGLTMDDEDIANPAKVMSCVVSCSELCSIASIF